MIVAAGCSFTSSDFKSWIYPEYDVSFKKWPEILADKFDTTLVNFGLCGFGNDYIVDRVVPFVLKNYKDIDLVVIGWTEATRFNFYNQWPFNPVHWLEGEDGDSDSGSGHVFVGHPYSISQYLMRGANIVPMLERLKDQYDTIAILCDLLDIKCVFGQMLPHVDYWKVRDFMRSVRDGKKVETYDKSHLFIGGPFNECIQHKYIGCKIESEYIIGPLDSHPNEAGHKIIADLYMKKYEELYG